MSSLCTLFANDSAITALAFSPDGCWLACGDAHGTAGSGRYVNIPW
ncbi:MAG: WD40 repeat domain-containing protein [Chloroflexota bacterium]